MGLDLFPRRTTDDETKEEHPGLTHSPDAPCPFKDDDFPIGMLGTCCSLRGKVAAYELDALGEDDLCERMHHDMTTAEALVFAAELRDAATRLEGKHHDPATVPRGAGFNGVWDSTAKDVVFQEHSTFEEALAAICVAADWYEMVGRLGFGTHAWY
ncbi:MAG: hypothetical protein JWM10_769 [Myxococcaceae bacterium]|nr:hypothetical protein [Myxococcaceae bacterium]